MAYSNIPVRSPSNVDEGYNSLIADGYYGVGVSGHNTSQYNMLFTNTSDVHIYRVAYGSTLDAELCSLFSVINYNEGYVAFASNAFSVSIVNVICNGNPPAGIASNEISRRLINNAVQSVEVQRGDNRYIGCYLSMGTNTSNQSMVRTGIYNILSCSSWDDMNDIPIILGIPITYYPTNVTLNPAPGSAFVGDTVTVGVSVPAGYTIRDPLSNIVVRNNGTIVPHTWDGATSQFTFVMPDPL